MQPILQPQVRQDFRSRPLAVECSDKGLDLRCDLRGSLIPLGGFARYGIIAARAACGFYGSDERRRKPMLGDFDHRLGGVVVAA